MDRVIVFSHEDEFLFELTEREVYDLHMYEEVNGEHKLTITTTQLLQKEQRMLTQDATGKWREWVVATEDVEHSNGSYMVGTYMAVWSLQHDLSTVPVSAMVGLVTPVSAEIALSNALSTTDRWSVGTVTVRKSGGASMYRTTAWKALSTLISVWGGEIDADITVDNSGVTGRAVSLYAMQGSESVTRRFDYGEDMTSIKRTVESDVYVCRIIPLGKGEESGDGYGRKITIEDVNDGKDYLQNDEVVPYVRVPDGNGGWEYPTAYAENGDIDEPYDLKLWGLSVLEQLTSPVVTYEADVLQLSHAGMDVYGIALGDMVYCVDRKFSHDGLRVAGRVMSIEADLLDPSRTKVKIGHLSKSLAASVRDSVSNLDARIDAAVASASDAVGLTDDYVSRIIERLNEEANMTGGYFYYVVGQGVRTYDKAVSDPTKGTEASQVVEIRGGNIRIANSKTSSGDWNWRTVIESGHLAIDLVTAARLISGYIGSVDGNYWNLDTGEFRMASNATLGGRTVGQLLSEVDDNITGVDIQYASGTSDTTPPTSGWSTNAPAWEAGKFIWQRTATLTPDGTKYSTPVMISGRDGTDGTSVTIRGSYNTLAELQRAHPTGSDGDAYMVAGDLYIWNGTAWQNVGQIQGPQGPAGTSVTVSSIQYGTSNSADTEPTSWSSSVPSLSKGKWLWVRTNYSNGSTTTTKSYIGTDGKDGKSVYVQSSTKVGDVTTVKLTDGTTTTTITIRDGEDGATGQKGEDGESSYVHIAWANSADGTQGFSPTSSEGKSYLGVYTDSNTADSSRPADYSWSKIEGPSGEDGTGISSIVEQYYLSTSSSSQAGGSWVTTPPAYVAGRFYWTRSVITWTDGTTTFTSPVLARGLNSANSTAASAQSAVSSLSTQEAIFNLLTNSGAMQGLYMQNGQLYINGTYIKTGYIGSTTSDAYWDLDNGDMAIITEGYHSDGHAGLIKVQAGETTVNDPTGFLFDTTSDVLIKGLHVWNDATYRYDQNYVHHVYLAPAYGNGLNHPVLLADDPLLIAGALSDTSTASTPRPSQLRLNLGSIQLMTSDYDGGRLGMLFSNRNVYFYANGVLWGHYSSNSSGSTKRFDLSCDLSVSGTKNRIVSTDNYGDRLLYCDETPSPMFTDVGSGTIGEDGLCYVEIDDVFSETARTDLSYQVFLQKCGRGDLWVSEKHPTYFVVEGDAGLAFDWQLKARQRDYENTRIEDYGLDGALAEDDPISIASEPISTYVDDMRYAELIESIYANELA